MTRSPYALDVRLAGNLSQDKLVVLREKLALSRHGRLGDREDATFGTRTIGSGDSAAELVLSRWEDDLWQVYLSYRNSPPSPDTVNDLEAEIRAAADTVGLQVTRVRRDGTG
jgi:hypothetical protein